MSVVKLQAFGGMIPAINDRLLPTQQASYARNTYFYNGTLIGWRQPKLLFNLASSTTRMAYRIPVDEADRRITADAYWLEFSDVDTKVLRTPVVDDTFKRYYYSSPSMAPSYNTLARIAADQAPWFLGVPAPTNAPGVSPSGGTGAAIAQVRSYVYTYVTAYGEESAPSPPLVQNGFSDDTWVVTLTDPPAANMGVDRNITTIRLYRTVTGTDGTASFFIVADVATGTSIYNDSLDDEVVALNDILPSTTWTPPPDDLQGMVAMANGIFAGFRENEIWFSEPFRPHTFPSVYTLTSEFPIMGLGVIGQSLVVVTKGYPIVITGNAPDAMTSNTVRINAPCNCAGSIAVAPDAVYYTSPYGLHAVTPFGTMGNVTEDWIDSWQTQAPQNSLRAIMLGYTYFAYGSVFLDPATGLDTGSEAQIGIVIQSPQTASQKVAPPAGSDITNPAFHYMDAPLGLDVLNFQTDIWTAVPYLIQDQKIYYYDFGDLTPQYQSYLWRSKIFKDYIVRSYSVMKVWFEVPSGTTDQNADRNTSAVQTLADDQYGIVRVYANGNLVTTRELRTSGELLRIASGRKCEDWQWEIEGRVTVLSLQAATSVKELANV